ncbi:MAG: YgiQ family radical SAM protein [Elusimicrobiota bacterium]
MKPKFFPTTKKDMLDRGWAECDIILITGDPYIDHHSYGTAVIARVLEQKRYKIGIIAQPDYNSIQDFIKLGKPRLFFGISSGAVDSMIANYSANKRPRHLPGGKTPSLPDRAVLIYSNRVREAFKGTSIVLGGLEASMRRLAHYDYWSDTVRRSIIMDAKADILVYGMAERQIVEIADRANAGESINAIGNINGTVIIKNNLDSLTDFIEIPSFEETANSAEKFNKAYKQFYNELSPSNSKTIVQKHGERYVIQFPPAQPLSEDEIDGVYSLPFARDCHPSYKDTEEAKGFKVIETSIVSHRGCPGECNFCGIGLHQGRIIQSRSAKSILNEAKLISSQSYFHGTISDIGGPTANLYKASCKLWEKGLVCKDKNCLIPKKCENLKLGYDESIVLYNNVNKLDKIKHVFVSSGIRYDLLVDSYADKYFEELCRNHISGRMKVAPEHVSSNVLRLMNKPDFSVYRRFADKFDKLCAKLRKKLFLVNYFISAHPGSTLEDAFSMAKYCHSVKIQPEQIQDYTPLPMTVSGCMYFTGKNPFTNEDIFTAKGERERKMQRALVQYKNPKNTKLVNEALKLLGKISFRKVLFNR